MCREPLERLLAVASLNDAKTLAFERICEEPLDRLFVVYEQNRGGVVHVGEPAERSTVLL
jgi:hypothetical protein